MATPIHPVSRSAAPVPAPSPLASGLLVIFGITGDLVRRKLLPALYHLVQDDLLPEHFEIVGVTRRGANVDELLSDPAYADPTASARLAGMMRIVTADLASPGDYDQLKSTLDALENQHGACLNRLFYLSIPPQAYGPVVDQLGRAGLSHGCQHGTADSRIMVEKPFGYDLASAQELIARLKRSFREEQIYRIDHYLAKETAQNILTFRFANPLFEAVWNHAAIERITVTASETIGIESRAAFYEPVGALRDFIQSHLLQLLAIVTMEPPAAPTAAAVHAAKLALLEAITPVAPAAVAAQATRGQYRGYRAEAGNADSATETFARLQLVIDNPRWRGVPVVLQTGKRLDRKTTEVELTFSNHGGRIRSDPNHRTSADANTLIFRLQPDEGIAIDLLAKKPGFDQQTQRVEMAFNYDTLGSSAHPDAYERVLMDGIRGDQTLFATSAEVLAAWRVVEAVVQEWSKSATGLLTYEPGATPEQIAQTSA